MSDRLRGLRDPDSDRLVSTVSAAVRGGVSLIQLREPGLEASEFCRLVERCLDAASGSEASVVVNDRLDVALAAGAHGVHLRADSVPIARVRHFVPKRFLIGRSVHALHEIGPACHDGVDYLVFGTVFPSSTKSSDHPVAGLSGLRQAVAASTVPLLAIGGLNAENIREVAVAGAAGIAAISFFLDADNPEEAARRARVEFERGLLGPGD